MRAVADGFTTSTEHGVEKGNCAQASVGRAPAFISEPLNREILTRQVRFPQFFRTASANADRTLPDIEPPNSGRQEIRTCRHRRECRLASCAPSRRAVRWGLGGPGAQIEQPAARESFSLCTSAKSPPAALCPCCVRSPADSCMLRSTLLRLRTSCLTLDLMSPHTDKASPVAVLCRDRQDATRTQNSMFGIRNLEEPRELSQPNQLDMVGPSRRFFRTFLLAERPENRLWMA